MAGHCHPGVRHHDAASPTPPPTTTASASDNHQDTRIDDSADMSISEGPAHVCGQDDPCFDVGASTDDSATLVCCSSDEEHCDEQCIVAAAELECEKTCETNANSRAGAAGDGRRHAAVDGHLSSACSAHLAWAFEQYSAYLVSARCVCRVFLERGWSNTCCASRSGGSSTVDTAIRFGSSHVTRTTGRRAHKDVALRHQHRETRRRDRRGRQEGVMCCASEKGSHCHGSHEQHHATVGSEDKLWHLDACMLDIEKASQREHVALAVTGITCSGCGNKMKRSLEAISGVSSVRVNFVMGQAEFDVDNSVTNASTVIKAVEKTTSFRCTRMAVDEQSLDVLASGISAKILADIALPGVTATAVLDRKTVRVTYDPSTVGARTLMEYLNRFTTGLAPPGNDPSISSGRARLYDQLFKTILCAIFTVPVLVQAWGHAIHDERAAAIVSFAFATVVQLIAVSDFYYPAISALLHSCTIEMDMLVVISITAAYTYSAVAFGFRLAGKPLETSELFETSALLITLVIFGRLVAAFARRRAVKAVSLRSLQAATAVIVEHGQPKVVDARLLQYGDELAIGPHSTIPTDGTVIQGSSEVNESVLTGESVPVFKKAGDAVIAGTVNGNGTLLAKLTRLPGKNSVTDIAKLVEEAQNAKPKIQDQADRVASWFVPIVTSIAIVVVIVWLIVGFKIRLESSGKSISTAITYAVATLAVSCPCALGLAVPMVLVIAGGVAARGGVIIKSAECTERARKVTDVVFDKTGTITEEHLDVVVQEYLVDRHEAVAVSKALTAGNNHPVSLAVARHLRQDDGPLPEFTNIRVIPGAGVEADLGRWTFRAGNPKWTETDLHPTIRRLQQSDLTLLVVARNEKPMAVFGLCTRLREEAHGVVAQLKRLDMTLHLVSGDQKGSVEMMASRLGIPNAASRCSPADKRHYVAGLMSAGRCVMFVGDGTNDAVAVSQADVGVQLGSVASASQVTGGAADVVLLNGLEGILLVMEISRASFRRVVFNFAWSATYNVFAILLASGAFINVRIPPAYAGLGEIVSVLPVILAALTMLRFRPRAASAAAA